MLDQLRSLAEQEQQEQEIMAPSQQQQQQQQYEEATEIDEDDAESQVGEAVAEAEDHIGSPAANTAREHSAAIRIQAVQRGR